MAEEGLIRVRSLAFLALLAVASPARADDPSPVKVHVEHTWSRTPHATNADGRAHDPRDAVQTETSVRVEPPKDDEAELTDGNGPIDPPQEELYRWTDSSGVVHYTNERGVVPAAAHTQKTTGTEIGVLPSRGRDAPEPPRIDSEQLEREQRLQADLWRSRFRGARLKLRGLQRNLDEQKERLRDLDEHNRVAHVSNDPYAVLLPDQEREKLRRRIDQLEEDLTDARHELDELDHRASLEDIPQAWRQ